MRHWAQARLTPGNALDLVSRYDLVCDGTDNFPTRFLVADACVLARRDLPGKEAKVFGVSLVCAPDRIVEMLKEMQSDLFERARKRRDANTFEVNSYDEFKQKIEDPGGFLLAHWDGTREAEDRIAADTKATIRCIPFDRKKEAGQCMVTGKHSEGRVVFAKAY